MTHDELSKHVGHEITVGVVFDGDEEPTGLSLDCHTCGTEIEQVDSTVKCVICGGPVEPWPTQKGQRPNGWGHNPDPLSDPHDPDGRACDACNKTKVIPARLASVLKREGQPSG